MMLKLFLATALAAPPVLGDTLLSGSVYFDSENTLLEVQELLKNKDTEGLVHLFNRNHISDKLPKDLDIVLVRSSAEPNKEVEFHFPNDPTTYWTYRKYVKTEAPEAPKTTPSPSPAATSTLPANLPSSLISPSISDPFASPDPPDDPPSAPKHKIRTRTKHYAVHRHHRIKHPTLTFWEKIKRTFAEVF
jgi:hypothetical protein